MLAFSNVLQTLYNQTNELFSANLHRKHTIDKTDNGSGGETELLLFAFCAFGSYWFYNQQKEMAKAKAEEAARLANTARPLLIV